MNFATGLLLASTLAVLCAPSLVCAAPPNEAAKPLLDAGRSLARAGEFERALQSFDEAVRADPGSLAVRLAMGQACAQVIKSADPRRGGQIRPSEALVSECRGRINEQVNHALDIADPWPRPSDARLDPDANDDDNRMRTLALIQHIDVQETLVRAANRCLAEFEQGGNITQFVVAKLENERLLAEMAMRSPNGGRQAATLKVTSSELLADIVIANLADPRRLYSDALGAVYSAAGRVTDRLALERLDKALKTVRRGELAVFLSAVAQLKLGFISKLIPKYPGAVMQTRLRLSYENYGYGLQVFGTDLTIDVTSSARDGQFSTELKTRFPDKLRGGILWLAPTPALDPTSVNREIEQWLANR